MKAYKTTLFIFAIIGLLALLCLFFPKDGVQIGPLELEFPSLEEVLGAPTDTVEGPKESPEELLARRLEEMRMEEESQYLDYFENNPARIEFPDNDLHTLDAFFAALDSAESKELRIVHYGDSQIEEDRISSTLRTELQSEFGGQGVGLVPAIQTIPTVSIGQSCDKELTRYLVYGNSEMRAENDLYGIMGQKAMLDTTIHLRFYPLARVNEETPSRYFTEVRVLAGEIEDTLKIRCNGTTLWADSTQKGIVELSFHLPDSSVRAQLEISGKAALYGIMLDGKNGVSVDNIPMRGCSGTIFTQMNGEQLASYFRNENVRLIIMQFGGNSVPYLKKPQSISNYGKQMARQIKYMKRLAPKASILFIGPSDMATKVKANMETYPHLPMVIDSLRHAVLNAGAAYWDLYSVMGGHNSMVQWVNAQPPLAASDYVHFSRGGAERIGDMLCKSLMLYYDYYKWRTDTTQWSDTTKMLNDSILLLREEAAAIEETQVEE